MGAMEAGRRCCWEHDAALRRAAAWCPVALRQSFVFLVASVAGDTALQEQDDADLAGKRWGTKVSELGAVACMRWAPCVSTSGWEPGHLFSTGS